MRYPVCRYKKPLIYLVLAYSLAQCYVLYMNTHHLFGGMAKMPMCPICIAAENPYPLSGGFIKPPVVVPNRQMLTELDFNSPSIITLPHYYSRAPPDPGLYS